MIFLFFLLVAVSCDDVETDVAYDQSTDFSRFHTYSWFGRKDVEVSALDHREIVGAIGSELSAKGLKSVDVEPDLYVAYFGYKNQQVRVNISHRGYSYGSRWDPIVMGAPPSGIRTFEEGSLVVDIYDADRKQLVWRGAAMGTLSYDSGKNRALVRKATRKLFESYPP
ncbi:MAG: DUF4136 domain-containing protein [bacterium]